jgi:hypothetical protein
LVGAQALYAVAKTAIPERDVLSFGDKPDSNLTVTFTPRGGYGNVNRDMLSYALLKFPNHDIYMMAFANSSDDLESTLLRVAELRVKDSKEFNFYAIGERGFAAAEWSGFLSMIGFEKDKETKKYKENTKGPWYSLLGKEGIERLRTKIMVGPSNFREIEVPLVDGSKVRVSAKVHHKVLIVGPVSTLGSSYNESASADSNQEQVLIWNDPELADIARGAFEGLRRESNQPLSEVVKRKNAYVDCNLPLKKLAP